MRALCWHGRYDVRVDTVPDPQIVNPRDAIVRVTSTAICGSDLHLYDGAVPGLKAGDVLGHEFMGEVVEVGPGNRRLKVGDRVVVPFTISCGACFFCQRQLYAACDNSNPAEKTEMSLAAYGHPMSGLFGYTHMTGGYWGGQAEYVRVPFADVAPIIVPPDVPDEQVLFLSDILPTGWQAAENCNIQPGDTVAVWGCGPVGLFTIQSAFLMGAGRVIAIDYQPNRLALAESLGAETLNFKHVKVIQALTEMTAGIGPDSCVDAVGMEAHGMGAANVIDSIKMAAKLGTDRPHVLREAIMACRKGGSLSMPGVYAGLGDAIPIGALMQKGLTLKTGQTHVTRYSNQLLNLVLDGRIDTTFLISHRYPLEAAAEAYEKFKGEPDRCTKVVLTTH